MMRALFFVLCLALSPGVSAETVDPRAAKIDICGRFEVFHINGILTTEVGAAANLEQLRLVYGNAYDGHLLFYGLAYNQTRGAPADLLDSFQQVIRDYPGATFAEFLRAVTLGLFSDTMTAEVMAAIAVRWSAVYDPERPSLYTSADLTAIETAIRAQHSSTARMLVVPHSQGNLYANLVYDRLTAPGPQTVNPQSIGIVGVATPASSVRGIGSYVTSSNDMAMNGVRFVFSNTLPANITIPIMDSLGHNLRTIYLTDANSIAQITGKMTFVMAQLVTPASDPPPAAFYQARVSWLLCGPGGYNSPYPCWGQTPQGLQPFTGLVVRSFIAGQTQDPTLYYQNGSVSNAIALAETQVSICHAAHVAEYRRRLLAGQSTSGIWFHGCGYGMERDAWIVHSADGLVIRTDTLDNGIYGGFASSKGDPVCRRT